MSNTQRVEHEGILKRAEKIKKLREAQLKIAELKAQVRAMRVDLAEIDMELVRAGVMHSAPTMCW